MSFHPVALLIELLGSVYLVGYVIAALLVLLRPGGFGHLNHARLLIASGAIGGLSFKVAATLLKTIELHTWNQIGLFVVTLALRTMLKRLFTWERQRLEAPSAEAARSAGK